MISLILFVIFMIFWLVSKVSSIGMIGNWAPFLSVFFLAVHLLGGTELHI